MLRCAAASPVAESSVGARVTPLAKNPLGIFYTFYGTSPQAVDEHPTSSIPRLSRAQLEQLLDRTSRLATRASAHDRQAYSSSSISFGHAAVNTSLLLAVDGEVAEVGGTTLTEVVCSGRIKAGGEWLGSCACPVIVRNSDNSDTRGRRSDVRGANLVRSCGGGLADFLIRRQGCRCPGKCSPVSSTWSLVAAGSGNSCCGPTPTRTTRSRTV